jgi:hypothetical protein
MKISLIVLITLFFSFTTITDNSVDRLGVKGPLVFNKINFKLTWTDKPNDKYYIQEYLPVGEKSESFNQMLTIHLFVTDITTENAVKQKVKELTARKQYDAVCNFQVSESPDGKEKIVDFLLGESKEDNLTIVEFNVYRYKQILIDKKKKAIIVYAYTKRSYGNEIKSFLKSLDDYKTQYLNEMISAEIPTVKIVNK